MIEIYPHIDVSICSPYAEVPLSPQRILWQGIHTCMEARCPQTEQTVVADLPVGHAVTFPCIVNPQTSEIFCQPENLRWLGKPLLESIHHPDTSDIPLIIEKKKDCSTVIILNCLDNYYGHVLLKLFNAERHLQQSACGVIVLVPRSFRWLVPDGVAEIWTIDVSLSQTKLYFPLLDQRIQQECRRFKKVFISKAHSHPPVSDITRFTRVPRHNFSETEPCITFIWREDRPWIDSSILVEVARCSSFMPLLVLQNLKVRKLFSVLRKQIPHARFCVAGLGTSTKFPSWIDDVRFDHIGDNEEQQLCQLYSRSRVVVGVHGSNMLLPSGHAGMTIDLMPSNRWGNFIQDIVYQERDPRMASYCYRYIPLSVSVCALAHILKAQILKYDLFRTQMMNPEFFPVREKQEGGI
jgi:hypothetical protein